MTIFIIHNLKISRDSFRDTTCGRTYISPYLKRTLGTAIEPRSCRAKPILLCIMVKVFSFIDYFYPIPS